MNSINTIEGLLFRSYLSFYNLSLIHKCIKTGDDDFKTDHFRKVSLSTSDADFEQKIDRAKKQTENYLNYCRRNRIQVIHYTDKNYPGELLKIKDFPPLLFVKGNLPSIPCAAVVGTRNPSPLAPGKVDKIVQAFAVHNYGMISGLATGIDTLAHRAALNNGLFTAAILPCSLDKIFPKENLGLAKSIFDSGGALITEQASNYIPIAHPFVTRNRIIAALSDYLIPVEMSIESGTRHAVNYAFKYGKKLILCKPNYQELDEHFPCYDGITAAIKKYRGKQSVVVISDLKQISNCIIAESTNQLKLL
jgi:DNA processing protein